MAGNSEASLISSLAPDAIGFNQILERPPGTQMFYDSMKGHPHAAMGGYGMRENDRYAAQMNEYMDALWKINAQRQGLAKNLLANQDRQSARNLAGTIYPTAAKYGQLAPFDHGPLGGLVYGLDNILADPYADTSDAQSMQERQAGVFDTTMRGVKSGADAGRSTPPGEISTLTGVPGIAPQVPVPVQAAGAGNSGSGGPSWGVVTTTTPDGKVILRQSTQKGRGTMPTATPGAVSAAPPGTSTTPPPPQQGSLPDDGSGHIPVGSPQQQAAVQFYAQSYSVSQPQQQPDGTVTFFVGPKGEPPTTPVTVDDNGDPVDETQ